MCVSATVMGSAGAVAPHWAVVATAKGRVQASASERMTIANDAIGALEVGVKGTIEALHNGPLPAPAA